MQGFRSESTYFSTHNENLLFVIQNVSSPHPTLRLLRICSHFRCLENALWNEFLWKMGLHFLLWKPPCQLSLLSACGSWDSGKSTKLSQVNTLLWREDTKEQKKWGQPRISAGEAGVAVAAYQSGWFFGYDSLYLNFTDFRPFSRVGILFVLFCEPSDFLSLNLSANLARVSFCCFQARALTRRDPFCRCGDGHWSYFGRTLKRDLTGFVEGLDMECEREESRVTS